MDEKTARQNYIDKLSSWSRDELLRTCRAGGLTAHNLKTNQEIAEKLWVRFGRDAWKRGQA